MPKIAKRRIEQNREAIEAAALALFTSQGFHGTNIRDISEHAGLSVGAIYTYYPNKEALFVDVVHSAERKLSSLRANMFLNADEDPFSRRALRNLADQVRDIVYDNADYWRLMYIDVLEFNNAHFADKFQNLAEQFRLRLQSPFKKTIQNPKWCGHEPGFVYATIYLNIMTYFLVEKLFAGNHHLGMNDKQAMDRIVDLIVRGLWDGKSESRDATARSAGRAAEKKPKQGIPIRNPVQLRDPLSR
jgi:AcrR family transcriptional regulator